MQLLFILLLWLDVCVSDPHVKVEGMRDDVLEAKQKILEVLETKVSETYLSVSLYIYYINIILYYIYPFN